MSYSLRWRLRLGEAFRDLERCFKAIFLTRSLEYSRLILISGRTCRESQTDVPHYGAL